MYADNIFGWYFALGSVVKGNLRARGVIKIVKEPKPRRAQSLTLSDEYCKKTCQPQQALKTRDLRMLDYHAIVE